MDTFVAIADRQCHVYHGKKYCGVSVAEHKSNSTPEQRLHDLWASLDNISSFWPTRSSLINLLSHVGFTSVYECHTPYGPKPADRVTMVAIRGQPEPLLGAPRPADFPFEDLPEKITSDLNPLQRRSYRLSKAISGIMPHRVKDGLKQLLLRLGIIKPPAGNPWEWTSPWKSRLRTNTKD
jgi:hypothetical protein